MCIAVESQSIGMLDIKTNQIEKARGIAQAQTIHIFQHGAIDVLASESSDELYTPDKGSPEEWLPTSPER